MKNKKGTFVIGGLTMEIDFEEDGDDTTLIPSFKFFSNNSICSEPYIKVIVGKCILNEGDELYKTTTTTNGKVSIFHHNDGFMCIVYDVNGNKQCVMIGNKNYTRCHCELYCKGKERKVALSTALLIIYIYASSFKQRLLIHSSTVVHKGKAYCFLGDSGKGKSTQSSLWVHNIPECSILNDDNPIIELCKDNIVKVWGSPWSGKTNYYINASADLCALVMMSHGKTNDIKRINGIRSFNDMLLSSSCFPATPDVYRHMVNNVIQIVNSYPMYEMSCLPNADAARMCFDMVSKAV